MRLAKVRKAAGAHAHRARVKEILQKQGFGEVEEV